MSLSTLQSLIKARLESHAYFAGTEYSPARPISIISEDRHDIDNEIEQAIAQIGLAVVIKMPALKNLEPARLPANSVVEVLIRVGENVLVNRDENNATATLKHCSDVALAVMRRLHQWRPDTAWARVECVEIAPEEDPALQIYTVRLTTQTLLAPL
ncbi:MAG: hypothetical protein AB1705_22170 [Verrucomicrobiota bacterium]